MTTYLCLLSVHDVHSCTTNTKILFSYFDILSYLSNKSKLVTGQVRLDFTLLYFTLCLCCFVTINTIILWHIKQ